VYVLCTVNAQLRCKSVWVLSVPETFEDGLENFAVGNCVGIIDVIFFFYRSLLVNVKTFDRIEVDALCLEL